MDAPVKESFRSGSLVTSDGPIPSTRKRVTLPDGRVVEASIAMEPWMEIDGSTGWVVPELLAPDPQQPRKDMDAGDLEELTESARKVGIRQIIDMTPLSKTPWARVRPEHRNRPLLIVAGHRRQLAATRAHVAAVQVVAHVYANKEAHDDDRSISNKQRQDVTELEEGHEMVQQIESRGISVRALAARWGYSEPKAQSRINLTKLDPAFWPLLAGKAGSRRPLATIVGGHLGGVKTPTMDELEDLREQYAADIEWSQENPLEKSIAPRKKIDDLSDSARRFEWQRVLLAVIRHRQFDSARATSLIFDLKAKLSSSHGVGRPSERHQPKRRLDIIGNLLKNVSGSEVWTWNEAEVVRICANSSREDVQELLDQLKDVDGKITKLSDQLTRIRGTKRATSAEVQALMSRNKKS